MKMEQPKGDKRNTEALKLLHPVCQSLMKDICKDNIVKLITVLGQVESSILQDIQQYVLFPIHYGLRVKNKSDSLLCSLCEALITISKKTKIEHIATFFDMFNPLVVSVTPIQISGKVSSMSEDTKVMVIQAMTSLLEAASDKVLDDFYRLGCLPMIGQLISVLLSLAQMEKSRSLQILALDCILVILQDGTKFGKMNEVHLGNLFAFCLPGVTMATSKIIIGDSKQGHVVFMRALKVWARIVTLVMSDCLLQRAQEERLKKQQEVIDKDQLQGLNVKRDRSWVKVTASKLKILVAQICSLVSHNSWKVRLSLAETVEQVLMSCCRSLPDSVPHFLEALIVLIADDYRNVSKKARTALEEFSASQDGTPGERMLVQVLKENLYNLATSLPRRLRMCDEEEKPVILKLFNGYISLLGPRINWVIESAPHLQRVSLALLQSLEMDVSNISILEARGSLLLHDPEVFTATDSLEIWHPRKYFKHFRDEEVLAELLMACRQLGEYGNVSLIVDHFLDLFHESNVYKLAAILVINEVVIGAGSRFAGGKDGQCHREVLDSVARTLLDEYLSSDNLRVIDRLSDDASFLQQPQSLSSSSQSLASSLVVVKPGQSPEAQKNILRKNQAVLLVSLCLEGVGKVASVLKQDFQVHLIQALYPLLENLGHENTHVSSSAYAALMEVAEACGYLSLDSLIRDNADYLTGSLSLRLRHFDENPRSPRTFCVVLRYGAHDLLSQIAHTITQLLDSLDDNYLDCLVAFMPVLHELTSAIGRWFPVSTQKQEAGVRLPVAAPGTLSPEVYAANFVDRIKTRQVEMGLLSDDETEPRRSVGSERGSEEVEANWQKLLAEQPEQEDNGDEDNMESCEEKTEPLPQFVEVVKEVLRRVRNLLCAQDGRLRVMALDVVCQACRDLAGHERELLPQIHELWHGFVPLFHSQDKFIVVKALNTLLVLAELSGDFLKQRTLKDVVPHLASFMEKQAKISSQSRSAYTFTGPYKLQLCALSTLGPLARHLDLGQDCNSLERVARMCVPYLSCMQPEALQKASMEAFTDFICLDSDAMWLLLCQSYCPCVPIHKCQRLVPVKFQVDPSNKNDLAKNITKLFQTHYNH